MHTIITKTLVLPLAFLASTSLAATESETRLLSPGVTKIDNNSALSITVKHQTTPSIIIRGEKEQISHVNLKQSGDTLQVLPTPDVNFKGKIEIEINLPEIQELTLGSSGSGNIEGFQAKALKLTLNASGSANVDAQFNQTTVVLNGSGSLNGNLHTINNLTLNMSGSGSANIQANTQSSKIVLTGAGSLNAGNFKAKDINLAMTGSGSANLSGEATSATIAVAGAGSLYAPKLLVNNLNLNLTGTGGAQAYAKDNADVIVKGAGSATIHGNPTTRNAVARVGRIHWQ